MSKKKLFIGIAIVLTFIVAVSSAYAIKLYTWTYIDLFKISRYDEDRVAFQHVNKFSDPYLDDSVETLLVIRDKKMYLFKDGFDELSEIRQSRLLLDMENKLYSDQEIWKNKMNALPDFVQVTDRRIELMKNFDEKFVNENFGQYYKSVRTALLKRHVAIFRQLMRNRKDSGLIVDRWPVDKPVYIGAVQEPTKFAFSATAKTTNETVYYCEDADGDGVTETFTVHSADGFNWGYKSGPNIVFIYNCDPKNEEIISIIGKLANESYFGTPEEEKSIIESLPKESEIIEMIDDLVPEQKFYK